MSTEELINSSLLNIDDKALLLDMINNRRYPHDVHILSIFSKKGTFIKQGLYNAYTYKGEYYYINTINSWFDSDLKLLLFTNWWYETHITNFLVHINMFIKFTHTVDISKYKLLPNENNYIAIQKWFNTYGHFLDETFCLYDFIANDSIGNMPFFSFPLETEQNLYGVSNYKEISMLLFGNNFYNSINSPVKVENLTLIVHGYNEPTFHLFPVKPVTYIINNIIMNNYEQMSNNYQHISDYFIHNDSVNKDSVNDSNDILFITRGIATHIKRNLDNQFEIENFLKEKNITIFNPENDNFKNLVRILQQYDKIIITWGSALVNLIFCKPFTEIIILKSKSYEHETIHLFNKIIEQRKLKITIITSIDNKIDPELIIF